MMFRGIVVVMAISHVGLLTFFLAVSILGASGVRITELRVPSEVLNGTGDPVLLDCEYSLTQEDMNHTAGLVVKWFFNNGPEPVYQWIIGKKPQELGILKGKLNLKHRVSNHNHTMHRALYIVNPTTELSGEYKCFVSTFNDEDFMRKTMIVYVPAKNFELKSNAVPELESVNVTCRAQGMYPEPKMTLYKNSDKESESSTMTGVTIETSTPRKGVYDIIATQVMTEEELQSPTVFDCVLQIPSANYLVKKSIVYYPGLANIQNDSGSSRILCNWLPLIYPLCLLLAYRFNVQSIA